MYVRSFFMSCSEVTWFLPNPRYPDSDLEYGTNFRVTFFALPFLMIYKFLYANYKKYKYQN